MTPAGTAAASACDAPGRGGRPRPRPAGRRARSPLGPRVLAALAFLLPAAARPAFADAVPDPAPCKRFESLLLRTDTPPPRADDRGVDVLSYDLDLRLDPAPAALSGQVELAGSVAIGLRALRAGVDTLVLDLVPQLACDAVTRGGAALGFARAGEEPRIAVPGGLATAAPETLVVAWHGRPPRHGNLYAGLLNRRDDGGTPTDPADDVPVMASISEPWSAHAWWPCKDHPSDKALVSLAATVPAGLEAVGNGALVAVEDAGGGWRRFRWRERYPLPTYLVSVAAAPYASWGDACRPAAADPVPLTFHALERDRPAAEALWADTCAMMDFLTTLLGPYPFADEKYGQVEVIWGGAMEHTTATSIGQFMFTGDRRYGNVVLHEMAHQWFGDSLTPAGWADIWLNEGFATYAEALWLEHTGGPAALRDFLRLIGPGRHPDLFAGDGVLDDPAPVLPNTLVYDKGAWVLHLLRGVIGDEAFFRFLRGYAQDPALAQGSVTLAAMTARAEAAAGRDLAAFFAGWVGTDAVPELSLETATSSAPGRGVATVTPRQHQATPLVVPVPLALWSCGAARPVTAVLERPEQVFRWELDCPVDSVTVDPGRAVLARWRGAPPPPLAVEGPAPNPVGAAGATFRLKLRDTAEVTVDIHDVRGRRVGGARLGQVAAAAPDAPGQAWRWVPERGAGRLPAGAYWFTFRAAGARVARRVTLLR